MLSEPFIGPEINIILFQFNPQELTRTLSPWRPSTQEEGRTQEESERAQPFEPGETIRMTLRLHAADDLEEPERNPVAVAAGVADRISALEMLLYAPKESEGLALQASATLSAGAGGVSASASASAKVDVVPKCEVPLLLFIWGPGRIVPVRLTDFDVTEQLFSPTLYPIQAEVSITMQIIAPWMMKNDDSLSSTEKLAKTAYDYTRKRKVELAQDNLANTVDSILGMLPF